MKNKKIILISSIVFILLITLLVLFLVFKKNKINKNIFYPGDIYKTGSGRYLVLEVNGDKLLVTKYGNPDYVVKNTTAVGKQKIDSISEESLNEFKIKLSKIAEVFG